MDVADDPPLTEEELQALRDWSMTGGSGSKLRTRQLVLRIDELTDAVALARDARDTAESRAKADVQREMAALRQKNANLIARVEDLEVIVRSRAEPPRKRLQPKADWRMPDPPKHCCGELMRPVAHFECGEVLVFHECRICEAIDESVQIAWPFHEEKAWPDDFAALGFLAD